MQLQGSAWNGVLGDMVCREAHAHRRTQAAAGTRWRLLTIRARLMAMAASQG